MSRMTFGAALAAAVLLAGSSSARADYISSGTGNSRTTFTSDSSPFTKMDGSVSFAVFDQDGGAAGDTYGTGIAGFDALFVAGLGSAAFDVTPGTYLYLYQIVNDTEDALLPDTDANSTFVNTFSVDLNGLSSTSLTSHGSFSTLGFEDVDGEVDALGNPLGDNVNPFDPSQSPQNVGGGDLTPTIITAIAGVLPTRVSKTLNPAIAGVFSVLFDAALGAELNAGERSILVAFTSKEAPTFGTATLQDGASSVATVVSIGGPDSALVPAPTAAELMLSMLPVLLVGAYFQKRRTQLVAG